MTMIGLPKDERSEFAAKIDVHEVVSGKKRGDVVEINGEQYAKLPEGWPAADAKDLEEAHAEAVMNDEPEDDGLSDNEREFYLSFTPVEIKELAKEFIQVSTELYALRKGMKTMQRKTRKQNQVQRRLERRLAQARASRDRHADSAETYRGIAKVNQEAAFELSMQQLKRGETVAL